MRLELISILSLFLSATPSHATDSLRVESRQSAREKPQTPPAMWLADYAAMQRLAELAEGAEESGNFADAARYFDRAFSLSDRIPSDAGIYTALSSALAYVKSGDEENALRLLESAAARGVRVAEWVENDADFEPLRGSKRFKAAVAVMRENAAAFRESRRRPEDAKLIFNDVERFWEAYDLAAAREDPSGKAAIFRERYLAPGTPGLIDYHWIKIRSMERMVERIEKSRAFYDGVRERTLRAKSYETAIRDGLRRFMALYPEASAPDVTFVIGRMSSGGTAGPTGMLIGVEMWSWEEGIALDGVEEGYRKAMRSMNLDSLPFIVVHEHIHALQQYGGKKSVLRSALQEGSADFLAGLALPAQDKPHYYKWGLEREAAIWGRFKDEMDGEKFENWVGNNSTVNDDGWYADLGYFIGARISEAYYEQAEDKRQAIRDLIIAKDPAEILEKSGYPARFAD